jgi:hypothetical protein
MTPDKHTLSEDFTTAENISDTALLVTKWHDVCVQEIQLRPSICFIFDQMIKRVAPY